ncbi:hypothetical protein BGZ67_005939 [Mortierella alpina]|nr:hypothetical protein BGZ67_005939 [Mortierella alpina]
MALNLEARQNLSDLIVTITKTGDLYLDADQVKIRYSSTQLIAEIFQRSHVFRELLVADYSIFLQLTVGIHQNKLPPPVVFAEKTKQLAISLTNEWNAKYGAVYKQIALGYEFLKYHLKVDFTNLVPVTDEARSAEQQAQEEMSKRLRRKRYEKAVAELDEKAEDIQENLRKMDSCFEILVPNIDDEETLNAMFDAPEHTQQEDQEQQQDMELEEEEEGEGSNTDTVGVHQHDPLGVRDNALGSNRYKLTISLDKDNVVDVHESEENAELFATLRECYRLIIKKHWPLVMDWLDVLMKVDQEPGESRTEYDRLLKLAIDLKKGVVEAKAKSEDLGINMDTMYGPHEQDSDEDIEFEEVEVSASRGDKKGKQPKRSIQPVQAPRPSKNPVFAMHGAEILKDDPTYAGGTRIAPVRTVDPLVEEKEHSSSASGSRAASEAPSPPAEGGESRDDLLARAPVLPWDDDLAVWDKKEMAFNTSGLEFSHRFLGVGDGSNMVSQATLDRMKMRTRIYNPELPEVIKACRYPMSNGKLCMRRDLVRCPYHGPVVPRDEYGQIQRPPEEGGFVHEDNMLDDEQEADLIQRAIAAASSSATSSRRDTRSSTRPPKSTSTWEDIEDDVHLALGLEKIEPKRKRGQGSNASSKKKKPPSALVNISKPVDSSRSRLLKHMSSKATKDSLDHDRRGEKAELNRDSRLHQW